MLIFNNIILFIITIKLQHAFFCSPAKLPEHELSDSYVEASMQSCMELMIEASMRHFNIAVLH